MGLGLPAVIVTPMILDPRGESLTAG